MKWYSKYLQVYEKPFAEAPQTPLLRKYAAIWPDCRVTNRLSLYHSSATMRRNICLPAFGH